ncbi:hypothetical protein [Streptomyces sp. NPDC002853]
MARTLAALPETRVCSTVPGTAHLLLSVWLRSPAECAALEERIVQRHPSIKVSDRSITLHTAKRMGRLLDQRGRAQSHGSITSAPEGVEEAGPAGGEFA